MLLLSGKNWYGPGMFFWLFCGKLLALEKVKI